MPWTKKLPNGEDAILAALPDPWKRIFRRKGQSGDGPEVDQRLVRPAWSGNDNPVELNAPQVTTGSLVSGRDPGEMVVARGANYATPQGQEPIATPPEFTRPRRALPPASPVPDLPILPKTVSGMSVPDVRGGDTIGKAMPVDPNQMPDIPSRNFSQFVLAPDQTKNPDYSGQGVPSQSGEQTIRPAWSDPYDKAVSRDLAIRDALANPSTLPKAHGWKRLLPIAVRAAQGIAATGSLGGGLGGAIEGGIETAVDPRSATKIAYQRKLGQADQNLSGMQAIRGAQIKQQGELADIGLKRSQTYRNLHPLPQTELVKVKGQGAFLVNKQTGSKMKVDLPEEVNPEEWEQTEANGLLYWRNKRTQETKPMTYNGTQLQNDADVPVDVTPDGGPTLRTRQGQAASALIEAGSRGATISNQQSAADREAVVKQIDDNYTQDATRRTQARQEVNDLQGLIRQAEAEQAEVGSPVGDTDEKKQAYAAFHAQKYKALWDAVQNKAQQIRGAYGDVIDESDQSLPEPGGGSIAEGVVRGATGGNRKYPTGVKPQGAKQAYPPPVTYRSAPVPKVSVRGGSTKITASSSEQEVRAAARALGKDENAAVEKWKKLQQ